MTTREAALEAALKDIIVEVSKSRCNGCGESRGGELADTCDACCALVGAENIAKEALALPSDESEAVKAVIAAAKDVDARYLKGSVVAPMVEMACLNMALRDLAALPAPSKSEEK